MKNYLIAGKPLELTSYNKLGMIYECFKIVRLGNQQPMPSASCVGKVQRLSLWNKFNWNGNYLMESNYLKYIVYVTVNKCNGKLYFGYHKTNPNVWDGYIGNGVYCQNDARDGKTPFHKAVKKYGYENFIRTTIEVFPGTPKGKKQARMLERLIVNRTLLKSKNIYNIDIGGDGGNPKSNKRVYKFDLSGNFLRSFACAMDAAMSLEVSDTYSAMKAIRNNCLGTTQSSFGYFWSYKKKFTYRKNPIWKPVAQYTLRGKFIRHFDSIMEAEEMLGLGTIQQAVYKGMLAGGFQWREFTGDTSDIGVTNSIYRKNELFPIIMVNLKTGEEVWYESIKECVKNNPDKALSASQINRVLKKVIKSHKGYTFKFDSKDKDIV